MTTYVGLLRGINVGGNNKLPMADLRALCEGAGFTDVRTYVQSGNVVFGAKGAEKTVAQKLHGAIAAATGLDLVLTLRTGAELRAIVAGNPFPAISDGTKLHAMFLSAPPGEITVGPDAYPPDTYVVAGREIYLALPDGMGRSKLAEVLGRQKALKGATARNWKTVLALTEMASA